MTQSETGLPETGDARIDAAIQAVAEAADGALSGRVPAFEAAHQTLREVLANPIPPAEPALPAEVNGAGSESDGQ